MLKPFGESPALIRELARYRIRRARRTERHDVLHPRPTARTRSKFAEYVPQAGDVIFLGKQAVRNNEPRRCSTWVHARG